MPGCLLEALLGTPEWQCVSHERAGPGLETVAEAPTPAGQLAQWLNPAPSTLSYGMGGGAQAPSRGCMSCSVGESPSRGWVRSSPSWVRRLGLPLAAAARGACLAAGWLLLLALQAPSWWGR